MRVISLSYAIVLLVAWSSWAGESATSPEDLGKELVRAVAEGKVERVRSLIKSGAGLEERNEEFRTPLMMASGRGSTEIVRLLLDAGANVNAGGSEPALTIAATQGHFEVATLLIKAGANLGALDSGMHQTALMWSLIAAPHRASHTKVALALIEAGSDVNQGQKSWTPLMAAISVGDLEVAHALIARGADVEANIAYAKSLGDTRTVNQLKKASKPAPVVVAAPAAEESPLVRLGHLISNLEASEDDLRHGLAPEEAPPTGEVEKASVELNAYVKAHPDDATGLILWARITQLRPPAPEEPLSLTGGREKEEMEAYFLKRIYAPINAALDRACQLEPKNAAAHYWKGRLSVRIVRSDDRMGERWEGLEAAIQHLRKAVALAPDMVAYRELLAMYLADQGGPGEGLVILKEASGRPHPMIPFLADLEAIPVPGGSEFFMNHGAGLDALYRLGEASLLDHLDLRRRVFELSMTFDEAEAFYRKRWPGFRLFGDAPNDSHAEDDTREKGMEGYQHLRWQKGVLKPAEHPAGFPESPKDGIVMVLVQIPEHPVYLVLINFRR